MINSNIDVSIIIPTHNRIELLVFTLLSLYEQSVSAKNFEVIVVDDASTDSTARVLKELQTPYSLKVLRNRRNKGAAYSRNRGIEAAKGDLIIFLDEMLVDRDFIKKHLDYHQKENMVVTTHFNGQRIFTHYYPNFSKKQRLKLKKTTRGLKNLKNKNIEKGIFPLFSNEDVVNHSVLRYGYRVKTISKWHKNLQNTYGKYLESMATPWFLCITNGLSVPRKLLFKAGLFDEKLKTWMEDWELGYRLYLAGATFYNALNIPCYHQTHPISRRIKDKMINYLYFSQKHPVIEVLLIPAMSTRFNWSVEILGKIITQYQDLEKNHNIVYGDFITAFKELVQLLQWHINNLVKDKALPLLKNHQEGFSRWETTFANKIKEQLNLLEEKHPLSNNYRELIKGFKYLLCLPVKDKNS